MLIVVGLVVAYFAMKYTLTSSGKRAEKKAMKRKGRR